MERIGPVGDGWGRKRDLGRSRRALGCNAYDGGMDSYWAAVVWSLLPTVVVLGLFVFLLRSILRMDRTERRVYAQVEAEERAKRGLGPTGADPSAL